MFITPAVAGERVFIGSCAGTFYAYDARTGEIAWSYDTSLDGPAAQFHGDALVTDELVVVGSDARPQGHLYAFDRESGEVRWKLPFPYGVEAEVLEYEGSALVVAADGEVARFALATAEPLWLRDPTSADGGGARNDPALLDGRLFVPWRSGTVDAYAAATGELLWSRDLGAVANTSAATFGGEVVVGTLDGTLYRLDPKSGEVLGRFAPGGAPYGDLVTAHGCLLSLWAGGGIAGGMSSTGPHALVCLEPGLAGERWRYERSEEWSTLRPLAHREVVIAGAEGRLVALSATDGALLWSLAVDGVPRGLGAGDDHLFVGTLAGDILAFPWSPRMAP